MTPDRDAFERALLRDIEQELALQPIETATAPDRLPGAALAIQAGQLALLAEGDAARAYQSLLWPRVRARLGRPADLVSGSYRPSSDRTIQLLFPGLGPPVVAEALSTAMEPGSAPWSPPRLPTAEDAETTLGEQTEEHLEEELLLLLVRRLDAGFQMVALEALWPVRGELLARSLWHDAELAAWDQILSGSSKLLAPAAGFLRRVLAALPIPLDRERFGVLLDIAGTGGSDRALQPPPPAEESRDSWKLFAAQELVAQAYPDDVAEDRVWIGQDETTGEVTVTVDASHRVLTLVSRTDENGLFEVRLEEREGERDRP